MKSITLCLTALLLSGCALLPEKPGHDNLELIKEFHHGGCRIQEMQANQNSFRIRCADAGPQDVTLRIEGIWL